LAGGDPGAVGSGNIGDAGQSVGQFGNIAGISQIAGQIPGPAGQIAGQLSSVLGQGINLTAPQGSAQSSGGPPLDITNAPQIGTAAANTLAKADTGAAKQVGQSSNKRRPV